MGKRPPVLFVICTHLSCASFYPVPISRADPALSLQYSIGVKQIELAQSEGTEPDPNNPGGAAKNEPPGTGTTTVKSAARECAVDLKSLCPGIAPGEGRIRACIQAHMSELSVGCSSTLSKAAWVSSECKVDVQHFCPQATKSGVVDCMRAHLHEVSDQCRGAIAFIASPAGD
jgi:hypothetical protein